MGTMATCAMTVFRKDVFRVSGTKLCGVDILRSVKFAENEAGIIPWKAGRGMLPRPNDLVSSGTEETLGTGYCDAVCCMCICRLNGRILVQTSLMCSRHS